MTPCAILLSFSPSLFSSSSFLSSSSSSSSSHVFLKNTLFSRKSSFLPTSFFSSSSPRYAPACSSSLFFFSSSSSSSPFLSSPSSSLSPPVFFFASSFFSFSSFPPSLLFFPVALPFRSFSSTRHFSTSFLPPRISPAAISIEQASTLSSSSSLLSSSLSPSTKSFRKTGSSSLLSSPLTPGRKAQRAQGTGSSASSIIERKEGTSRNERVTSLPRSFLVRSDHEREDEKEEREEDFNIHRSKDGEPITSPWQRLPWGETIEERERRRRREDEKEEGEKRAVREEEEDALLFGVDMANAEVLPCDDKGIGLTGGGGGVYPIHHSRRLSLLVSDLCSQQKVQELAANIAFRLLDALAEEDKRRKGVTWSEERRALRKRTREGEEGHAKNLILSSSDDKKKKMKNLQHAQGEWKDSFTLVRSYWPDLDEQQSKMGVFVRDFHEALYLLFEPRLFSSSSSSSSPSFCFSSSFLPPNDSRSVVHASHGVKQEEEEEERRREREEERREGEANEEEEIRGENTKDFERKMLNGELVFSLLHPQVMSMVVPSLKPSSRLRLLLTFLHCIESYVALHPSSKSTLDPNRLFLAVGPARFLLLVSRLNLLSLPSSSSSLASYSSSWSPSSSSSSFSYQDTKKDRERRRKSPFLERMSSYTVDHLFLELLKDPGGNAYEAIRWARLISDFEEVSSLQTLLKSSRWSLEEVLASVSSRRSENLLRAFFDGFLLGDVNEERRLEEKEEKKKRGRKDPWSVDGGEGLMFSGASEGEEREEKNEMIKSSMEIKMKEEEEEDEEERERRERLMIDACEWLARKCPETGTIVDPWGYLASRTVATRLFSRNLYDLSSSLFSDTHTRRRLRDTSIIERERGEEEEEKIGEQKNLSRRSTTDVSSLISSAASSSSVMSTQGNTATKSEREKKLIGKQDYEEEISLPQTEEGLYSSLPFSSIERDRDPGLPDSPSPSSSQTSHEVCTVFLSRGAASSLTERKEDKELKVRLREQEEREKGREVDVEEGTLITLPSAYTDCDIDSPYRHMESEFEDTRSYLESVSWHLADKEDAEEDNEKRRREEEEGFFLHPLSPLSPGVSTPGGARNTSSPSLEEEEIKHKRRETRIEDDLSSPNTDRDNLLSLDSSLPSSSSLYTIPPSPFPPSSSSASPSVRPADRSTGNRVYPSFRLSPELLRDSLLFIDDTESLGSAFEYIRVSQESFCSDMRYQDQGVYSSHPTSSSSSCSSSPLSCVSVLNRGKEKKDRSLCDLKKDKRSASEVSPLIERSGDPDPSMTGTPAEHLDTSHTPASPPSPCSSCSPPSSSSASSSLIPPLPAWMVPFHPFVVALDLEWSLPHAASILTLATENRVYIIDVTNQDLLYQKTLLHMLRWVFGNPFILKLMYQGGQDLLKLFFHLRSAGRPGRLVHCVDLRQPRVLMERRGRRDGRRMHPPSPPPLHSSSSDLNTCREKSSPSHDRREQPHCSLHDGSCLNHDIKRQEDPPSSPYLGTEDFTLLGHEDTGDRYLTDGISDEGTTSVYTASSSTETEVNPEKQENGEGTRAHKKKEEEKKQRQFGEVKVGRKGRWSLEEEDEEEEVLPGEKGAIPRKLKYRSLQEMCQIVLGVDLDKSEQKSNWNLRPLTSSQVLYAAKDAYVLILLESALRRQGWYPENILGGLGEGLNAFTFRGPPSNFLIDYRRNAKLLKERAKALGERRLFRWEQ